MRTIAALGLFVAMAVANGNVQAEDLKSGLQPGAKIGAFYVEKCAGVEDGVKVGDKLCYRCRLGNRPVVTVFTRSSDGNVAKLLKEIDRVVADDQNQKMASFVNFLATDVKTAKSNAVKLGKQVENIATVVPVEKEVATGPAKFKISPDADVTVMIYRNGKIAANHALASGKLNEKAIKAIIADTNKILD